MSKGASIKFKSYEESIPKILDLLKLQTEMKKYDKIIIKPFLSGNSETSTSKEFLESVIKFCLNEKNPVAEIFVAEGADGYETSDLFHANGYQLLAEKYPINLIDLNNTETEETTDPYFHKFSLIQYPRILKDNFIISISPLSINDETQISGTLSNMLGAYPTRYYSGFFSKGKNKIRKWPIEYSIHDIIQCKMPDFSVLDASKYGLILAGLPIEIDKQAVKVLGESWGNVKHISLIEETYTEQIEHSQS